MATVMRDYPHFLLSRSVVFAIRKDGGCFHLSDTPVRSTNFRAGTSRTTSNGSGERSDRSPANALAGHDEGGGVGLLRSAAKKSPGGQNQNEQRNGGQQVDVSGIMTPADFPAH
jgi:hypothetical protein